MTYTDSTHLRVSAPTATTGVGELTFRHRADLSELPDSIAKGIVHAHGGFAKAPGGVIYFGLEATGVVRVSPDLQEKSIVVDTPEVRHGGLHNTTYLDRDGGLLVLPDNGLGLIHIVRLDDGGVETIGRPDVNEYYADPKNGYAPTDTDVSPDGTLYVCDGYSKGKYVLKVDLDRMTYLKEHFGGPVPDSGRTPARFSTNHGITYDPFAGAFWIADRERNWAQLIDPSGAFLEGLETRGRVCDIDLVEWQGEPLLVAACLRGEGNAPGVVHLIRGREIVSTLRPKLELGLDEFEHIHNAAGVVVDDRLFVLCYGWNPGCYAVLELEGT